MIKFNILGKIEKLNVPYKKIVKNITKAINRNFAIRDKHIVSFIIVDNDEIHAINQKYRNIDSPTDIITFANIDSNENGEIPFELGDIFINYERVTSQALDYGHSETREFAFLVTHGLLHSLGYDHQSKVDEEIMFGLQDQILDMVKIKR